LQYENNRFLRRTQATVAVLLVALVLLLDAMAACPALHELVHHDADEPGHECAVTLVAHGQMDLTTIAVPSVTPIFWTEVSPVIEFSAAGQRFEKLQDSRGPPVLLAVS